MITFNDIIGYEKEKEELMYICDMIKNFSKYTEKRVYIPRALLLYGEPGTGKTTMAKALINESGRKCFYCKKNKSNGDFVDEIRNVFEEAKKNAPSIIFLDDMDKFAEDNLDINSNKEEFATIQACMEDLENAEVFVLATANDIMYLPESLLRTGRFGRKMEIGKPDQESIKQLINHFIELNNIKSDISAESLSTILVNNSCATIKEILNEAQIYSIYKDKGSISKDEMTKAILKNTCGEIEQTQDKSSYIYRAIHEAGHATVALLNGWNVSLVSITSHGESGGFTRTNGCSNDGDGLGYLKKELQVALAGKAATELNSLDIVDFGAENDIDKAAEKASYALRRDLAYGFNYGYDKRSYDNKQAFSRLDMITTKTYEILEESYKEAKKILIDNKNLLEILTNQLLEHETLLYDDVNCIFNEYIETTYKQEELVN